jgi:hypothetical protein
MCIIRFVSQSTFVGLIALSIVLYPFDYFLTEFVINC